MSARIICAVNMWKITTIPNHLARFNILHPFRQEAYHIQSICGYGDQDKARLGLFHMSLSLRDFHPASCATAELVLKNRWALIACRSLVARLLGIIVLCFS